MNAANIITVVVSLIGVLAVGVVIPVLLVRNAESARREDQAEAARLHREDRDAEWARQDEVAARAAQTADAIAAAQQGAADRAAEAARLLLENNERVAQTQLETNGKLDVIHTLVNSSMTAAMQSEFDAVTRELAMMREVVELKRATGMEPSTAALAAIDVTETKLSELADALDDRAKAQAEVNHKGGGRG